jgi:hypothetical protein
MKSHFCGGRPLAWWAWTTSARVERAELIRTQVALARQRRLHPTLDGYLLLVDSWQHLRGCPCST